MSSTSTTSFSSIIAMEKTFFKIIIPNYNNIAYIKRCLDSILQQTFQDFKIIVVDDMSTDLSDKFCEMYARKHSDKIIFIPAKQKCYAGTCRNIALDYPIECSYVWAIDGDDYISSKDALAKLYAYAKSKKHDAIFFNGYRNINQHLVKISKTPICLKTIDGCDPQFHWLKISKPECFGRYLENCMVGQDLYHSYLSLDAIKTYINVKDSLYVYQSNESSVSNNTHSNKEKTIREQHRKLLLKELKKLKLHNSYLRQNLHIRIKMIEERIKLEEWKAKNECRKVVVAMSSFPARKNGMVKVIKQLISQCDKMLIWLNDYDKVPSELKQFGNKIEVHLAGKLSCLKENGRYTWIDEYKDAYYLTVDDDINYPKDYVQQMVAEINRYKQNAIVSFHGTIFANDKSETFYSFQMDVPYNIQVHRVGGGVMGLVPEKIKLKCPKMQELVTWDGDASLSVWATQHKVKKYVVAHRKGYLTEQQDNGKKISHVNALCLNNDTKVKRQAAYAKISQWEKLDR